MVPVLARLHATHVFCSPAQRCRDTLRPFLESSGIPFSVREALRERQLGANWLPDYRAVWRRSWVDFSFATAGGESSYACRQRMMNEIESIRSGLRGRTIILGIHGHAMGLVLTSIDSRFSSEDALRLRTPEIMRLTHDGSALDWDREFDAGLEFHTITNKSGHPMKKSVKAFTLVEIMIVVVIIGLLASMAIPAFQKVRASSQDKAVLNNLRQLSSAADQYFLEKGMTQVNSTDLVGTNSSQYIKQIQTVARETYTATINQGTGVTATGVAGSRTITFTN
jgi:prepilin-type N-terminal cleavage/methylation domain-containing protein